MLWTFMERVGTQLVTFIVGIVLARLLLPDDYGVIAIVLVFVNICDVFVTGGMGMALVQKKDTDELDCSTIFWVSLITAVLLYVGLFFAAPIIADFYDMPILSPVLRVLGLRMPLSSFNTVQRALVQRNLNFKVYFYASLSAVVISAVVGIVMAWQGAGVWALVAQQMFNAVVSTLVIFFIVRWFPRLVFSLRRFKRLFSFAWKALVAGLIDAVYEDFRSLYIGKLYTAADLAYYTRGRQFPTLFVSNVNATISTVLFPVLSKQQNDVAALRSMTRRFIKTSGFVLMPVMAALLFAAEPLVRLLLTDKWLPCVPFVQILCLNGIFTPFHTANIQAIYAMGRSDLCLRMNIIKKTSGFLIVLVTAYFSVICMAWGGVLIGIIASVVNAFPNKRLLGYSFLDQILDILPALGLCLPMGLSMWACSLLPIQSAGYALLLQLVIGGIVYLFLAWIFKVESLRYCIDTLKRK